MYKYLLLFCVLCSVAFAADQSMTVKVGESFTVSRPENAGSTGYSWASESDNERVVSFTSKNVAPPKVMMPGAPGTAYLSFKALKVGHTTITLVKRRPWEAKQAPAETYTVDVTVTR